MGEWFKGMFSLSERKNSTIMMGFIVLLVCGVWGFVAYKKFDTEIMKGIISFGLIIGGVNGVNSVVGAMYQNNSYDPYGYNSYNNYNSPYMNNSYVDNTVQQTTNAESSPFVEQVH